ncbi:MAG TPA: ferritin-like domain-containing protein [Roseiflexaceae bacterium]|nr:ferritin-like domain-containing protein [Roseiflexaceae bacterium]
MTAPPPVTTRAELIYLLSVAAELEHSLACQYLFTAFSLKQAGDPGVSRQQVGLVRSWAATIEGIALQEMQHLALACNLLTAVGGAPNLRRPNFPQLASAYRLGMPSSLAAFGVETLRRYACWERPEEPGFWDQLCAGLADPALAAPAPADPLDADERRYRTIAELYHLIDSAFDAIPAARLFVGPPAAQVGPELIPFRPPLIRVSDAQAAHAAIRLIVVEGEGTPGHTEHSHFARFYRILTELRQALQEDPAFEPAWPVLDNPLFDAHTDSYTPGANRVTDPLTRRVGMLFTACYDLMLQLLMRLFGHGGEDTAQLRTLANACMSLMTGAIRPLGVILTRMPAGAAFPGRTAGPSFETYLDTQPSPHRSSAWAVARERFGQIADDCEVVARLPGAPGGLREVALLLDFWRGALGRAAGRAP